MHHIGYQDIINTIETFKIWSLIVTLCLVLSRIKTIFFGYYKGEICRWPKNAPLASLSPSSRALRPHKKLPAKTSRQPGLPGALDRGAGPGPRTLRLCLPRASVGLLSPESARLLAHQHSRANIWRQLARAALPASARGLAR